MGTAGGRIAVGGAVLAIGLALAPAASAAPRYAGAAAATITACAGETLTVAGQVTAVSARTRRPARLRRTTLQVRFDALPLFGLPRRGPWRNLGARSSGSAQETFRGLPFDTWTAVMRYRFRQGRTSVAAGAERVESRRVGRARGRALCILPEGVKPRDITPPAVFFFPEDERWRRAPTTVRIAAIDDFSGVTQVLYRLNGGEFRTLVNNSTFDLAAEGVHLVEYTAVDRAGNYAPLRRQTLRVDAGPPTAPSLSAPRPITASTTPTITWTAATDSGSGVLGYFLAIERVADGAVVATHTVPAATTSIQSPVALADGHAYRVTVTAFDATDPAWATGSAPREFRVDTSPEVAAVSPAAGTVLRGGAKSSSFALTLDRPADPATVTGSTVVLDRQQESAADPAVSVTCDSACTTITVTPASSLPEGRYVLRMDGVRSDEGVAFPVFTAAYSVPFYEEASVPLASSTPACVSQTTSRPDQPVTLTADTAEPATLGFDWSLTGAATWRVRVLDGGVPLPGATWTGGSGSGTRTGSATLPFTIPAGTHALQVEFHVECGSLTATFSFTASNIAAWRNP